MCDDHLTLGSLVAAELREAGHEVEVVGDPERALDSVRTSPPDVCVLDLVFPGTGTDGALTTSEVLALSPGTGVLLLTGNAASPAARRALVRGARGLLDKDRSLSTVVAAVERVGRGEVVVEPGALRDRGAGRPALTARERDTLLLLAQGRTTQALAAELRVSVNTARKHVQRVLDKLGAASRLEAVSAAYDLHLVEPVQDDASAGRRRHA